jgi:ATP-binding cassette subfamily F protein 3
MTVEDLSFSFSPDGPALIEGLSFGVGKKDRIAVIGKNGKGKTTLLNLLAREMSPTSGDVKLHPNTKIAYFGQTNINRLQPQKTALQEVMDSHPDCGQGEGRAICGLMMFEGDNALKKVSVLSGGERSRVLLGKLLVSPANLLMLDEPTNHLDMESIDSLIEAIEAFDGAVIIVTHSELILEAVATKLIVYDNDTVSVFEGTYLDFLERVGWSDEGGVKVKKGKKQEGDRNGNRKDAKKLRTAIISDRSKALSSLKKRITALEEEITKLEYDVEQDTQRLLEVTVKGEALNIKKLSQAIRENKARIDNRFAELQTATNEHDEKAKTFDQQLAELAETT